MPEQQDSPNASGVTGEIRKNIARDISTSRSEQSPLSGQKIGISISDNEELGALGYSIVHIRDLTIEIARQLLIDDAHLVYGGDLRREGYTEIFSQLSYQYRAIRDIRQQHCTNYFSFPIHLNITKSQELEFKKNRVSIEKVGFPADLHIDQPKFINPDSPENKYIWARSLSYMRETMIRATDARILIGGKLNHYSGKMPGVLEEGILALQLSKPLYLVAGLGGATAAFVGALTGRPFTFSTDSFHQSADQLAFTKYYNEHYPNDPIDFKSVETLLAQIGLEGLSKNNGLIPEENERLFYSPHLPEIVYYISKGLNRIAGS